MKPKQKSKPKSINLRKIIAFTLIAVIGISVFLLQNPKPAYAATEYYGHSGDDFSGNNIKYEAKSGEPDVIIIYKNGERFPNEAGSEFKYIGRGDTYARTTNSDNKCYFVFQSQSAPNYYLTVKAGEFGEGALICPPGDETTGYVYQLMWNEDGKMGPGEAYVIANIGKYIDNVSDFSDWGNYLMGEKSDKNTYSISGRVVLPEDFLFETGTLDVHLEDEETGKEIAKNTVSFILGQGTGGFQFTNVKPGKYRLWVNESGLVGEKRVEVNKNLENIEIKLKVTSSALLDFALKWMVGRINEILSGMMQWSQDVINSVVEIPSQQLAKMGDKNSDGRDDNPIVDIWNAIRIICNSLFIIGLLIIAFANVLQLQIDMYAIKAILPRFIAAVILVNFSLVLCRVILDFANLLSKEVITISNVGEIEGISSYLFKEMKTGIEEFGQGVGLYLTSIIFAIIAGIASLLLAGMLLIRVLMVWFLVIVAPVAFLLMVLPFTRGIYSTWWKWYARFIFMGPVAALILAIGSRMAQGFSTLPGDFSGSAWLIPFFCIAMVLAAFAVPTMLGGAIMGAAVSMARRAGGLAWGATGKPYYEGFKKQFTKPREAKAEARVAGALHAISGGRLGKPGALLAEQAKEAKEAYQPSTNNELIRQIQSHAHSPSDELGMLEQLAGRGIDLDRDLGSNEVRRIFRRTGVHGLGHFAESVKKELPSQLAATTTVGQLIAASPEAPSSWTERGAVSRITEPGKLDVGEFGIGGISRANKAYVNITREGAQTLSREHILRMLGGVANPNAPETQAAERLYRRAEQMLRQGKDPRGVATYAARHSRQQNFGTFSPDAQAHVIEAIADKIGVYERQPKYRSTHGKAA